MKAKYAHTRHARSLLDKDIVGVSKGVRWVHKKVL